MNLNRLENETESQQLFRLGQLVDSGAVDWDTVADTMNQTWHEDDERTVKTYRNRYTQARIFYEDGLFKKQVAADTLLDELRKERIKLQTLNVERGRYDREVVRQELFYEYVGSMIDTLPPPNFQPLLGYDEDEANMTYVVTLADAHYGARFVSQNNEYSSEIFVERLELVAADVAEFVKKKKVPKIVIASLGDDLNGILRMSDLKMNDSSVVQSLVEYCRIMAKFLNELSAYVEIDYYHVGTANHTQTRPLGSKASQIADEDLEYVIGNYISDLVSSNNRIHTHLPEAGENYLELDIPGFEVVATHGHTLKSMENALRDISMLRNSMVDYVIAGHLHSNSIITNAEGCTYDCEVIVCPSLMGSNPYADSIFKGSKAAFKIYGFDEIYGLTETYKYILN